MFVMHVTGHASKIGARANNGKHARRCRPPSQPNGLRRDLLASCSKPALPCHGSEANRKSSGTGQYRHFLREAAHGKEPIVRSRLRTRATALACSGLLLLSFTSCSLGDPVPPPDVNQNGGEPGEASSGCPQAPDQVPGAQAIVYDTKGRPLRLFVLRPADREKRHPAILFFFGGGWRTGSVRAFQDQAKAFQHRGFVTILADYRVRCRDDTTPLASTRDARKAYEWVFDHATMLHIDKSRIVLSGGSAGGQLAAAVAMLASKKRRPAALVLFNPAVDLVTPAAWYLKPFARRISPSALDAKNAPPTIIFHGQSDTRVPITTVRSFCGAIVRVGGACRLWEYPGQVHGFYHDTNPIGYLGRSPFDDTLAKAFEFLKDTAIFGVTRRTPRPNASRGGSGRGPAPGRTRPAS
ncbi:alpha/beta hydrolase [Stakelama sp. CBK3Z-3]|uniref:Alpha/beta hydrolase n=1 Tax=Stakelama flava TaxID=2860338 RepID=A0ABS6XI26_9SPHN|nr:alpha/beta hydrolase [Stakelama flava]MBW4329864.1 alpha/beta hydrolase [Stakelama flava]